MKTGKGKFLAPLIVSIIALLVLVNFTPMASNNALTKPYISTNNQTIWIYQGHRLIYHGPGNANNDSFGLGTITQDAGQPITYNATIYQPDWEIDGNNLYSGSSHTFDLSPGNYSYDATIRPVNTGSDRIPRDLEASVMMLSSVSISTEKPSSMA